MEGEISEGNVEVQTSSHKINKPWEVIYHLKNMVNNIVATLYRDRCLLDLSPTNLARGLGTPRQAARKEGALVLAIADRS